MVTYKIHFIRHGMTQANIDGVIVGVTDVPVCPRGLEELQALADNFEYPKVDEVYCSPLTRCRQTAEIFYPDNQLTLVEDLHEMNFGKFENKTVEELKNDDSFVSWVADSINFPAPEGESGKDFAQRLFNGINTVFADMMRRQINSAAVVTHAGVIMTLLSTLGFPQRGLTDWPVENGKGYTIMMTPQMWMRDNKFEIIDTVPSNLQEGDNPWDIGFYAVQLDEDEENLD